MIILRFLTTIVKCHGVDAASDVFQSTTPIQYPVSSNWFEHRPISTFVVLLITADLGNTAFLSSSARFFFNLPWSLPCSDSIFVGHSSPFRQQVQWLYHWHPVVHQSDILYIYQHFLHCIASCISYDYLSHLCAPIVWLIQRSTGWSYIYIARTWFYGHQVIHRLTPFLEYDSSLEWSKLVVDDQLFASM